MFRVEAECIATGNQVADVVGRHLSSFSDFRPRPTIPNPDDYERLSNTEGDQPYQSDNSVLSEDDVVEASAEVAEAGAVGDLVEDIVPETQEAVTAYAWESTLVGSHNSAKVSEWTRHERPEEVEELPDEANQPRKQSSRKGRGTS